MYAKLAFVITGLVAAVSAAPAVEMTARSATETGDATYYSTGLGSCGETSSDSQHIVALSVPFMANGANPNNNPKCNKNISIHYQGKTISAKVVDTCQACAYGSIDLSPSAFQELAPLSVGRLHGVTWTLE